MRPYFKALLALLTTSSVLLAQEPAPICGLPHISQISPDAPVSLHKAVGVLTGDRRFKIRKDVTSTTADFIEVDFYSKYSDSDFEVYVEVAVGFGKRRYRRRGYVGGIFPGQYPPGFY